MKFPTRTVIAASLGALLISTGAWAQTAPATEAASSENGTGVYTPQVGQSGKDVVWVPTANLLVERMLDMAELKPDDRLVDLGSGDGRTVIAAAKRGVSARGIEYNPELVELSRQAAKEAGVAEQVVLEHGDIFESDFSEATVLTLFLLPSLNLRLRPTLLDMPPGTRILSNSFHMEEWQPDDTVEIEGDDCASWCRAYKWVVPAKVEGEWKLDTGTLHLTQSFQMLEGSLQVGGKTVDISEARMDGTQIRFLAGKQEYVGQVAGDAMQGSINGRTAWSATR